MTIVSHHQRVRLALNNHFIAVTVIFIMIYQVRPGENFANNFPVS